VGSERLEDCKNDTESFVGRGDALGVTGVSVSSGEGKEIPSKRELIAVSKF